MGSLQLAFGVLNRTFSAQLVASGGLEQGPRNQLINGLHQAHLLLILTRGHFHRPKIETSTGWKYVLVSISKSAMRQITNEVFVPILLVISEHKFNTNFIICDGVVAELSFQIDLVF